jgi:hypothetical protein
MIMSGGKATCDTLATGAVLSTPIFTPGNEPYLGRELLFQFDNLISSCLALNSKYAPMSHSRPLSGLQRALCILVPQTITLALSIRELIRQGYLFGVGVDTPRDRTGSHDSLPIQET